MWSLVLTSAGVAALVSSIVSGLLALLRERLERSARRKELLLRQAAELAKQSAESFMRGLERSQRSGKLVDPIISVEAYYQWLSHLLKHDRLPNDYRIRRPVP